MKHFRVFCPTVSMLGLALLSSTVVAQQKSYPEKPITLLVPYGPDGNSDQMARGFAEAALIEGIQQVAMKRDESLSPSLFTFRSHLVAIHRD